MAVDLQQIENLGIDPVPGDAAEGANIQGEADYEWVERSFKWLTSVTRGSEGNVPALGEADPPSWSELVQRCGAILRERSKHFRVAVYLAIGLFEERQTEGLNAGLKLVDALVKNYWETMFPPNRPKLLKARASALEFLATYTAGESQDPGGRLGYEANQYLDEWRKNAPSLSGGAFDIEYEGLVTQFEGIKNSLEVLAALKTRIYELFPQDMVPSIVSLSETYKKLKINFEEVVKTFKPPDPVAEAPAVAPATAATPTASASPAPPTAAPAAALPSGSAENAEAIRKFLKSAAPVLREADPADPAAYHLARIGIWGGIDQLPPVKEGNTTRIDSGAVTPAAAEALADLEAAGNWLNLLNQAENTFMRSAPLWLELQYYAHRALTGLGPAYEMAAQAVAGELRALLKRLPGLETLEFANGMPFADGAARQWIEGDVAGGAAEGGGGGGGLTLTAAGGNGGGELREALGKARSLAKKGDLASALALLQSGASGAGALREKFRWQTAMAQMAGVSKKPRHAQPILEELVTVIDQFNLSEWEPELCIPVLGELYKILKADKTQQDKARAVFGRLCKVDIETALKLEKK